GEVVAVLQRDLRGDLDLAAQVNEERAVGDLADPHALELVQRVGDAVGVLGVPHVRRDVDDDRVGMRLDDVERGDHAAYLADRRGQVTRRACLRRGFRPDRDRVTGARDSHGTLRSRNRRTSSVARAAGADHGVLLISVSGCSYGTRSCGKLTSPNGDSDPCRSAASSLTGIPPSGTWGQDGSMRSFFSFLPPATSSSAVHTDISPAFDSLRHAGAFPPPGLRIPAGHLVVTRRTASSVLWP